MRQDSRPPMQALLISLAALALSASPAARAAGADPLDALYANPVYQTASDLRSCVALPDGLPRRLGRTADTRAIAKPFLDGRAASITWTDDEGGLRSSYFYATQDLCESLELARDPAHLKRDPDAYVAQLQARYGARLHFQSARAEQVIRARRLDCAGQPGRYVPLVNLLYASLGSFDQGRGVWLEITVEDQDGALQVINALHGPKAADAPGLGERRRGLRIAADGTMSPMKDPSFLRLACINQYGPIWRED